MSPAESILLAVAISVVANELHAHGSWLALRIVKWASLLLPVGSREVHCEEWTRHLEDVRDEGRHFAAPLWSLGAAVGSIRLFGHRLRNLGRHDDFREIEELWSPDWKQLIDKPMGPFDQGTYRPIEPDPDTAEKLKEVAVHGKIRLVVYGSDFFGNGADFTSDVMESPTWAEIRDQVTQSIYVTGDMTHVFMEVLTPIGVEPGGIAVYRVFLGS